MHLYALKCKRKIYHFAKNKMKCSFPMKNIPPMVFFCRYLIRVYCWRLLKFNHTMAKGLEPAPDTILRECMSILHNIIAHAHGRLRDGTHGCDLFFLIFWSYLQSENLDLEFRLRAHDRSKIFKINMQSL